MRLTLAVLVLMSAGSFIASAHAECTRPRPDFTIPDGKTATEQDINDAQRAIVALDGKVGDYLRCIHGEASQSSVGKDDAAKRQIVADYIKAHNEAAVEVTGLAQCFNAQVQAFKASGGGKQAKPVDCKPFIDAAAAAPPEAPAPIQPNNNIVKEADGHTFDLSDGVWSYILVRDDTPRRCGADMKQQCVERAVYVSNNSSEILECRAYITYAGADIDGKPKAESQAVVDGKSMRDIVHSYAAVGVGAQTFEAQCTPRSPLPKLDTPPSCKYEVVKPVNISDYYPDESRKLGEEGPVVVEFTVAGKAANPTNVKVVGSSLVARLDKAAIDAVSAMVLSSSCEKKRYRLRMSFKLEN